MRRVGYAMTETGERARVEAWALVAVLVGVGALGTGVGYFLDWRLGTRPWLLMAGATVGLGAGLFFMLRSALAYSRREKVAQATRQR